MLLTVSDSYSAESSFSRPKLLKIDFFLFNILLRMSQEHLSGVAVLESV